MSGNTDVLRRLLAALSDEQLARLVDLQKVMKSLSGDEVDAHLEVVEAVTMTLSEREDPQGKEALKRAMEDHEVLQGEQDRRAAASPANVPLESLSDDVLSKQIRDVRAEVRNLNVQARNLADAKREAQKKQGALLVEKDRRGLNNSLNNRKKASDRRRKPKRKRGMEIYVRARGKTLTLHVDSSDEVELIKYMVQDMDGVPLDKQRLIFAGKYLENDCPLADYNIQDKSTLHLTIRQ